MSVIKSGVKVGGETLSKLGGLLRIIGGNGRMVF